MYKCIGFYCLELYKGNIKCFATDIKAINYIEGFVMTLLKLASHKTIRNCKNIIEL